MSNVFSNSSPHLAAANSVRMHGFAVHTETNLAGADWRQAVIDLLQAKFAFAAMEGYVEWGSDCFYVVYDPAIFSAGSDELRDVVRDAAERSA